MEPTDELIDSIYLEKVHRARQHAIDAKMMAGLELFRYGCEAMRMGIRVQNPDASPQEVEEILRQRLELGRRLQEIDHGSN